MIVYVESNFVLEIALSQEQASYAESILSLAESGKVSLAFPSFALSEPFATITYRRAKLTSLFNSLELTLEEMERSEPLKQFVLNMRPLVTSLKGAQRRDFDALPLTIERMLAAGRAIETDLSGFKEALGYQASLDLSPQDSIIYATVLHDLRSRPDEEIKCFLSRDKRAFLDEGNLSARYGDRDKLGSRRTINAQLKKYGCRYISSFDDGLNFIKRFA